MLKRTLYLFVFPVTAISLKQIGSVGTAIKRFISKNVKIELESIAIRRNYI